ncbi:MAG TPA: GNAT family N-acetyltransferase [Solirubrobacterales bacterium]|nr:GNAT family N-acetyltransferase [Solirubrobacterales bacterium]
MSPLATATLADDRLDPVTDPAWTELLGRCEGAEVFHHPLWLELLRAEYGYEIEAHCVRAADGAIAAALPVARIESRLTGRRLVALPFSDTCGPLVADDADAGPALGEGLARAAAREGLPLIVHAPLPGVPEGCRARCFVRHELPLATAAEEVEAGFSKGTARNLAKAERAGLRFEIGHGRAALDGFYRLHLLTRRKLGVPTQPRRFIRRFERLFDAGLGFVGTVSEDGEALAAGVFLSFAGTLTYKYGASDPARLAARPNHLLHAAAIRHGCERGLRRYDLGRSDLDAEGLRRFKRGWGAAERDLFYTYVGPPPPQGGGDGAGGRLGAAVIKRSPVFVGRAVGRLLYRHHGR